MVGGLGGSFLLWAWIRGFPLLCNPQAASRGQGVWPTPPPNHTADAVASPTWTKRQGETGGTASESGQEVSGVMDARGLKDG